MTETLAYVDYVGVYSGLCVCVCVCVCVCLGSASFASAASSRQVPGETASSSAGDHLGRRADRLLPADHLQAGSQTAVRRQQVPVARRQDTAGRQHRTHARTGRSPDTHALTLYSQTNQTFLLCKSFPPQPFLFFSSTDYIDSPDFYCYF